VLIPPIFQKMSLKTVPFCQKAVRGTQNGRYCGKGRCVKNCFSPMFIEVLEGITVPPGETLALARFVPNRTVASLMKLVKTLRHRLTGASLRCCALTPSERSYSCPIQSEPGPNRPGSVLLNANWCKIVVLLCFGAELGPRSRQ